MTHAAAYLAETAQIAAALDPREIDKLAERLRHLQGRLWCIGLGGGAANASHAAADFRRLCWLDAVCLTDSAASFSALANDDGWPEAFGGLLAGRLEDALFVFSVGGGSGGVSAPIVRAVEHARGLGMQIFGIVGRDGGYTKQHGDCVIVVPTVAAERVTPHTEGWQMVILHALVSHPMLQRRQTKW